MKMHGLSWVYNYCALEKGILGETGGIDLSLYPKFSIHFSSYTKMKSHLNQQLHWPDCPENNFLLSQTKAYH